MSNLELTVAALVITTAAMAQTPGETIERALAAAPRQMHDAATVIQWKADGTYETLKKGRTGWFATTGQGSPVDSPSPSNAPASATSIASPRTGNSKR